MTHRVYFQAEQSFLSFVKMNLSIVNKQNDDAQIASASMCIIACVSAIEATVNLLLKEYSSFNYWDELKLSSKLNTVAELGSKTLNWAENPWQDISRLIKLRNFLVHFKEQDMGLINTEGDWIKDEVNKAPKIDPIKEINLIMVERYYHSTRLALKELVSCLNIEPDEFEFLDTEEYEAFLV